jgi:hypothetical protein
MADDGRVRVAVLVREPLAAKSPEERASVSCRRRRLAVGWNECTEGGETHYLVMSAWPDKRQGGGGREERRASAILPLVSAYNDLRSRRTGSVVPSVHCVATRSSADDQSRDSCEIEGLRAEARWDERCSSCVLAVYLPAGRVRVNRGQSGGSQKTATADGTAPELGRHDWGGCCERWGSEV